MLHSSQHFLVTPCNSCARCWLDMLMASLILGLFAPVLAFGIASGSGMSILNTIAYTGQTYGVNIGMSSYIPAAGNGSSGGSTSPTSTESKIQ